MNPNPYKPVEKSPLEPAVKPLEPAVKPPEPAVKPPEPAVKPPEQAVKREEVRVEPTHSESKTVFVMSPLDSYVSEKQSSQPVSLEEIERVEVRDVEKTGMHRLSLSDYFEKVSAYCTRGDSCTIHRKDGKGNVQNPGKWVFRWVFKHRQALAHARDVRGWNIVNRTLFRNAPEDEFLATGAVERGDALLMFLPIHLAKAIRELPGKISNERIRGQMTPNKKNPRKVLMTGNPDSEHVYQPVLSTEESEEAAESKGIPLDTME